MELRKVMKKMNTFRGGVNTILIVYIIIFMLTKEKWIGFLITFIVYNLCMFLINLIDEAFHDVTK